MVPPKPRTDGALLRQRLTDEGIPVFATEIPRLAAFEKAAADGVPVYSVKEDRNAARHGRRTRPPERRLPHDCDEQIRGAGRPAAKAAGYDRGGTAAGVAFLYARKREGRGRPPGKRSNPEWKLYSHFLKKKTQREAAALLVADDDGRDLSDVLQDLLEGWTRQRKG